MASADLLPPIAIVLRVLHGALHIPSLGWNPRCSTVNLAATIEQGQQTQSALALLLAFAVRPLSYMSDAMKTYKLICLGSKF